MNFVTSKLTVYFENPFWVGVYERVTEGKLEVCRVVFGAEPKDIDVYQYFLTNYAKLRFSPPIESEVLERKKQNPKRLQRVIKNQIHENGIGTKAQQAIKKQREQMKSERKVYFKKKSEEEKNKQFEMKMQKKKEKHRGR